MGVWSSDRRIGGHRLPVQLVESLAGLGLAVATWFMIHVRIPGIDGVDFVVAMPAYALVRRLALRLRAERREFSWRRNSVVAA